MANCCPPLGFGNRAPVPDARLTDVADGDIGPASVDDALFAKRKTFAATRMILLNYD
jgi:hypothetical protein